MECSEGNEYENDQSDGKTITDERLENAIEDKIKNTVKGNVEYKVFKSIAPEKIVALRSIVKNGLGVASSAADIGDLSVQVLKGIYQVALKDIGIYRAYRSSPTLEVWRPYQKIIDWGKVDWKLYDPGMGSKREEVLRNFLNQKRVEK